MPRQLNDYKVELAVSKLPFPDSVTDLILEYGCKVNDYLLVFFRLRRTVSLRSGLCGVTFLTSAGS